MDFFPIFVFFFPHHIFSQAIRYLLQKWGTDNVNDLIVDETIDNFEMIRVNGVPFFNNNNLPTRPTAQTTQTSNPPPTDSSGFDHFNSGYNYPNPNNNVIRFYFILNKHFNK